MKFGLSIRHCPEAILKEIVKLDCIDFVEIAAEEFIYRNDYICRKKLDFIHNHKPVAVHSYSLSLLDPRIWQEDRLNIFKKFFQQNSYLAWSDHYAVSSWKEKNLGSLTPAPVCDKASQLIIDRINLINRAFPDVLFMIENAAAPFLFEGVVSTVDHFPEFIGQTKSKMLLDLSNLVANELNFGISAKNELKKIRETPIGEIHLAGGTWDRGFYRDSHASSVENMSWDLLREIAPKLDPETLILIEWEQDHPKIETLIREVNHAKAICRL
jgi:uncharacterized protein (UPF0276 family)